MALVCDKNLFGFTEYDGKCDFFGGKPALSQTAGWIIVAGFGAVFSVFTTLLVWLDYRYGGTQKTSEQYNSAGRSIKVGLTACDIVSKWTWAATLLQSSNVAYKFGVSGPFWYASGATIQVLLFAVLAIEIKRKAPTAHTILEIIQARWGKAAHMVFFVFCLLTNIVVTSMLILGGAGVVNALTGVNLYAAAFVIPMGVVLYTAHGGLKATFIASWVNTTIIYIALCTFTFLVYAGGKDLGSPSKVYDNLMIKDKKDPIKDNRDGSSLTMFSKSGLIFGVINIIGNFGTVFVDQSYWQSAIAAKPSATYKGYLLGGLCWFAVPFSMATAMGLGARALDLPITIAESNNGLVPPAMAVHLLGKGGAFLLVLQLFVAVVSTASAEQIAVSSLVAYDVYRAYFNKKATGKQIVFISRCVVVSYGILSGVMAIVLFKLEVSLGWVYLFMGIVVGSAVAPIYFALTWNGCTATGAITGAVVGQIAAIITWLVTAQQLSGEITLDTTGADYPMLAGNLVAIFLSAIVTAAVSLKNPQNFDWAVLKEIPVVEHDGSTSMDEDGEDSPQALNNAYKWTLISGGGLSIIMILVWPALALPVGVFTKGYFYMWVSIAMIWGLLAATACFLLPIWEARETIVGIVSGVLLCKGAAPIKGAADSADKVVEATKVVA